VVLTPRKRSDGSPLSPNRVTFASRGSDAEMGVGIPGNAAGNANRSSVPRLLGLPARVMSTDGSMRGARSLWDPSRSPRSTCGMRESMHAKTWRRVRREALQELVLTSMGLGHRLCTSPTSTPMEVDLAALADLGITSSQFSCAIYNRVRREQLPNFFKHVRIDPDGGMDRIADIWEPTKVFWFFLLVASVAFNVASILALNWTLTEGYMDTVRERVNLVASTRNASMAASVNAWGVGTGHVRAGLSQETVSIFESIQDPDSRQQFLSIAVLMATFEVSWVICSVFDSARRLWIFATSECEFKSYMSLRNFFQDALPHLSGFSSIALIAKAHPSLVVHEYQEFISKSPLRRSAIGYSALTGWFLLTRVLLVVVAVSAFAVKLVATGLKLISPDVRPLFKWAAVVALLNNCMGCIAVGQVLQDRLFLFVFAGQDTEYQDDERALRDVYRCRVSREIWKTFAEGRDPWGRWKAIVLLATWDHYDLQRLLIEPVEVTPSVASRARSFFSEAADRRRDGEMSPRMSDDAVDT